MNRGSAPGRIDITARRRVLVSALCALGLVLVFLVRPALAATGGLSVRYHTFYGTTSNQIGPLVNVTNGVRRRCR
jgi:hypothetical protein